MHIDWTHIMMHWRWCYWKIRTFVATQKLQCLRHLLLGSSLELCNTCFWFFCQTWFPAKFISLMCLLFSFWVKCCSSWSPEIFFILTASINLVEFHLVSLLLCFFNVFYFPHWLDIIRVFIVLSKHVQWSAIYKLSSPSPQADVYSWSDCPHPIWRLYSVTDCFNVSLNTTRVSILNNRCPIEISQTVVSVTL